MADWRNRL